MHAVMGTGRLIAGRYRLHEPIGRGAMGIVWRGRDELLDRDVAVKEVQITAHAAAADAEVIYQRTLREARTAARLSHPSVVTVFDVVEEDGSPWIVMELIDARSLDQIIAEDGPLPPEQAADLGKSLVSALATAHSAGVLHRDVKPSNVLVTRDGRAVLTDFGIATFAEDVGITQAGMVVGTPGYTAPERIRGDIATPASDLWSLGATLYAAVEGRGPFERAGGSSIISSGVASEDAPRAPSAGPLGPVIDALLSRDPGTRPDAGTVERLLADAATEARTGPRPLSHSWLSGEAEQEEPGTEDARAPVAGQLGNPDSGFLDAPDYEVLQISQPATDGSVSSGESAVAGAALAATGVLTAAGGAGGPSAAGPAGSGPGIVDPASGPVLWGPAKAAAAGSQLASPQPGGRAGSGPGGGSGRGGSGGGSGQGGGGPADGDGSAEGGAGLSGGELAGGSQALAQRPWRSSRAWRVMVAAAGIAAFAVVAVIGWNIFQHSGPASALGSETPPGLTAPAAGSGSAGSVKTGTPPTGSPGPGASTGAHAGGNPSGMPSPGSSGSGPSASPGSGGSPSGSPSPSSSASPTPTPTPTGPTLPAGYTWHKFSAAQMSTVAGFEIGLPDAWTQSINGAVAYLSQAAKGFHLAVNLNYWLYAEPLREAQYLEAKAAKAHPDSFRVLTLTAIGFKSVGGYRAAAAAELKYSWKNTAGSSFTELVILVTLPTSAGAQAYQFSLWAPSSTFSVASGVLHTAMPTFRPLPV
jgi:serine/threonine protein kinase